MGNFLPPSLQAAVPTIMQLAYLIAMVLFILGIKRLSSPDTARTGNIMASLGMLLGVLITLLDKNILSFEYIIGGIVVGGVIGLVAARKVAMTSMPEMVAIFNGFGGGASALVAWGSLAMTGDPSLLTNQVTVTIGISIFIGSVTFSGSMIAYGKLQGMISGNPITFTGQHIFNLLIFIAGLVFIALLTAAPASNLMLWVLFGLSLLLGILMVIPIGGADMPVVISLLNSMSGLAASATGFVINNNLLIISGALVGAAGFILTTIMCQSMNRKLTNVLFGAFGSEGAAAPEASADRNVNQTTADDVAIQTAYSDKVVIVPGYGLAVAQAQHVLREVADMLENKGVEVMYGIHPVAGRMPGHMNVLLAEADVPYDQLLDLEEINREMPTTDVVLIIGANDVVNPAAKTQPDSPIYGMPVVNVEEAKRTIIFKRSLSPGFSGIDNELFYSDDNQMFFGDAKDSLTNLADELKEL